MQEFIDIGCDVGESFGVYRYGYDEEVMDLITSANIACGFHAGDPVTMRKTVIMARNKNIAVGAHPGLPDLMGFGRRFMNIPAPEICDLVTYQIGALDSFCRIAGVTLRHVKFHGALARMFSNDEVLAAMLADSISSYNNKLILVAFAGSQLEKAGLERGLSVAGEVLIDRGYNAAGNLIPVREAGGIVKDPRLIMEQAEEVIFNRRIRTAENTHVNLKRVHTLGFHYGTTGLDLVKTIRARLENAGIKVRPLSDFLC
ncbi:MAG: LamB/YcsF family protein [Bacillota bacterium]